MPDLDGIRYRPMYLQHLDFALSLPLGDKRARVRQDLVEHARSSWRTSITIDLRTIPP